METNAIPNALVTTLSLAQIVSIAPSIVLMVGSGSILVIDVGVPRDSLE